MTDRCTELYVELKLTGPFAEALVAHAKKRSTQPGLLLEDIVEVILGDDLVDAVLDDRT